VQVLGSSEDEVAAGLEKGITATDRLAWSHGTTVDWANETFGVAKARVYRGIQSSGGNYAPHVLPSDYALSRRAIVAMQLERAGVRLAALLNQHLR
jgi:hypothetical protein